MIGTLKHLLATAQQHAADQTVPNPTDSALTRARNAGTVIAVVVIGLVAMVGIMIFSEVSSSMPDTGTQLDNVSDDIVAGFGDAMGLVPIILLVLLASVVIGVVQRMRT